MCGSIQTVNWELLILGAWCSTTGVSQEKLVVWNALSKSQILKMVKNIIIEKLEKFYELPWK